MIPFVQQTATQKKISKCTDCKILNATKTSENSQKVDHRENNICLRRKNDKCINKRKQKSVRLWVERFLSTDKSNHHGGLKGEILTSRTVECNVTSALQR